jgi:hypothetical protein
VRQVGEPLWVPEIGLGIGRVQGTHEGWEHEWPYGMTKQITVY